MKKILIIIVILVIGFFLLKFFRPVIVRDADTGKPISGADVSIEIANFATGCGAANIYKTNSFGIIFSKSLLPCRISSWKNGYHVNGYNSFSESKGFLFSSIELRQIKNSVKPFVTYVKLKQNQGIDMLSAIESKSNTNSVVTDNAQQENIDFSFPSIINVGKMSNTAGPYEATIKFYGDGGIQKITDKREPTNDASASYFAMENLLMAPKDGYQQELVIKSGESYVAKLRDGDHYIKFHPFMADSFSGDKETYVCMTTFSSPNTGPDLNFEFIYYGGFFCGENDLDAQGVLNRTRHFNSDHWYEKAYPSDDSWQN